MGVFVSPPNPAASRSGPAHGKPSRTAATAGPREESAPSGAEADLDRAERYGHALEALPAAEAPIQRVLVIKGQGSHSSITKRTPGLAAALKAHPAEKHDQIVSALHDLAQSDKTHKLGGFPAAIDRALSARSSAKKKQGTKVKRNRQLRGPVVAPLALPQPVADESSSESESESDNEKEAVAEESGNESSGSLDVQVGSDSERKIGSDSERKVRSDDERKVRSDDERSDSERKSEASSSDEESDFSAAEDAPGVKAAIQDKGLQFGEDGSLLDKDGQPLSKNARKGVYQKLGLTHTLTGHGPDLTEKQLKDAAILQKGSGKFASDRDLLRTFNRAHKAVKDKAIDPKATGKAAQKQFVRIPRRASVAFRRTGQGTAEQVQTRRARVFFKKGAIKSIHPFAEDADPGEEADDESD